MPGRDGTLRRDCRPELVSLSVPPATIVGLVGPNGAGKSTLFSVLSGLHRPNGGRVLFEGADITRTSAGRRARLGLARTFQHPEMFAGLTTREHLQLAYRVSTRRSRIWTDLVTGRGFRRADQEEAEAVEVLLDALNLTDIADRPVAGLPLGMTRLVEIARALAANPRVLLFDEPSSGLDAQVERVFEALITLKQDGVTILLVEQFVHRALEFADHAVLLYRGRVAWQGPTGSAKHEVLARYLGETAAVGVA